uniref:Palmitoyltransferase n=1 Tax=Trichuris muris TaxID=70415 RepID=A0A5S6QT24_TRIMR
MRAIFARGYALQKVAVAQVEKFKFLLLFLFYNSHCDLDYAIDVVFEPVYRFVDGYVKQLGRVFLGFLVGAIGLFVLVTYTLVVPYELPRSSWCEVFLYFSVGHPPMDRLIVSSVGVCRSCIRPKPPRSHHCSVCGRCILKMDHHCPWLDQCVGHYNHRYYYLTMVYMWLSCAYVVVGTRRCFVEHYWAGQAEGVPWCASMKDRLTYANWFCHTNRTPVGCSAEDHLSEVVPDGTWISTLIVIEFLACAATLIGLTWLLVTHFIMISKGETSIEHYINKAMKKKYAETGKAYVNPYDFGWAENWRSFLGIDNFHRDFLVKILLPSNYVPRGDGLSWPLVGSSNELAVVGGSNYAEE